MLILSMIFIFIMSFSGFVFGLIKKGQNKKLLAFWMGIASGIMLATTIWSLFIPSFEYEISSYWVIIFFIIGGIIILVIDSLIKKIKKKELNSWQKIYTAVTIHNIPEGIIIGVAYGLSLLYKEYSSLFAITIAIGIQNLPESIALSVPLSSAGLGKKKILKYGFFNSIVEPISAIIGFCFIMLFKNGVSLFMSFAAGTMFYVIVSEVIPESVKDENSYATVGSLIGFVGMVILEIFL